MLETIRKKLAKTEENCQFLIENVNSIVLRMDPDGKITFFNRFAREFFGFDEDIIGKNVVGSIVPETESTGRDLRALIEDISLNPHKYVNNVNENMRKNGERVWVAWSNKLISDQDGQPKEILCIGNDITDRKWMEDALKESEVKFRSYVDNSPIAILMADQDGYFIDFNQAACDLFGYDHQEFRQMHFTDLHPRSEQLSVLKSFDELKQQGYKNAEFKLRKKDGQFVWTILHVVLLPSGNSLGYCYDITEKKNTLNELEKSRNTLQQIIDSIPVRVFWKDADSRFLGCNIQLARDAGLEDPHDLIGKTDFDFPWKEQAPFYQKIDQEVMSSRQPILNITEPQTTPSGDQIWLNTSKVPLIGPNREIIGILGVYEDVTVRKQNVDKLHATNEALRAILDATPVPVFDLDTEGRVKSIWNKAAERLLGWTYEEVIGKYLPTVPDNKSEEFAKFRAMIQSGQSLNGVDVVRKRKDGTDIEYSIFTSTQFDPGGKAIGNIAALMDITERRKNEKALQESEERLRLAMEVSKQGWFRLNIQTGKIETSPEYAKIIGHDPAEFITNYNNWISNIHPDDLGELLKKFKLCISSGTTMTGDYRRKAAQGTWQWIRSIGKVVEYDTEGKPLVITGTHADISELKASEESLRQSEEQFSKIFLLNPMPMMITLFNEGTILAVNEGFMSGSGFISEEIIGKTAVEIGLITSEDRSEIVGRILQEGRIAGMEMNIKIKSGHFRECKLSSEPILINGRSCILTVIEDVTEQKRLEVELEQSRNQLAQIIDFLPDATFVIDREKRVIIWNRAMEDMTGIAKADILGKGDYEYAIPFYGLRRPLLIDLVYDPDLMLGEEYEKIQMENGLIRGETYVPEVFNGKGGWLAGIASSLYDNQHNIAGAIESIRDITRRRQSEESMIQQERIRALGEIAGGVAHDIRNQLMIFFGIPEMMLLSKDINLVSPSFRTMVEKLKTSAEIMQATVARLQDLYRPSPIVDSLDLNTVITASLDITKHKGSILNKQGIHINTHIKLEENLPKVKGSENEIKQMLVNLILNSIDAIGKEGNITIQSKLKNNRVIVSVSDDGCGMPKEILEKCMEPFVTTKGEAGTGLGLHSVRMAMIRHKGELSIESIPDKGTVVSLIFPLCDEDLKATQKTIVNNPILNILLIEDEEPVREMTTIILEFEGHSVTKAENGCTGLSVFFTQNQKFDLVITDYGMSDINGHQVIKEIRKMNTKIPMILATGFVDTLTEEEITDFENLGCIILRKPFRIDEINEAISIAIAP